MYGTFNHPYSFSEKEITETFSNLYFQGKGIIGYGKTERVFSDADLAYVLAPLLMEGFTLLGPTQYLLVYNSLTRPYLKKQTQLLLHFRGKSEFAYSVWSYPSGIIVPV